MRVLKSVAGISICISITLLVSCNKSGAPLFELIEDSGIEFNNVIVENDSMNLMELEYFYRGGGVAIGDLNNDGLPDVILGGNMVPTRVYLNKGDFQFQDITEASGLINDQWVNGISLVDINNDGLLDIYLCSGGSNNPERRKNMFYISQGLNEQQEPYYINKALEMGLASDRSTTQAAFFDYDLDGDLDVIMINSDPDNKNPNIIVEKFGDGSVPNTDQLFENQFIETGEVKFTDLSIAAGIKYEGFSLGLAISDFNLDGLPDIYVANDHISNDLIYINNGDKTFSNRIGEMLKTQSYYSMGVVVKDLTNNGYTDIFTLDMLPETNERRQKMMMALSLNRFLHARDFGYQDQFMRNTLQVNAGMGDKGLPAFTDIGQLSGIHNTDWSWGSVSVDFDLDSRNDIFVANGYARDITDLDFVYYQKTMGYFNENIESPEFREVMNRQPPIMLSNYAFANRGDLKFEDVTQEWGLDGVNLSNGVAYADFDLDGDMDLIINHINQPASVYRNNTMGKGEHFIKVLPVNKYGIPVFGVKSYLHHNETVQFQELYPVQGFQSFQEPVIHYGLGGIPHIDSLVLVWPDGKYTTLHQPAPDSLYKILDAEAQSVPELPVDPMSGNITMPGFHQGSLAPKWQHKPHEPYMDFRLQPLMYQTYSKEGPLMAEADIDNNGLMDFFVGSGPDQDGTVYMQFESGFKKVTFSKGGKFEDMDAEWIDIDGDGDLDLYVATGSANHKEGHPNLQDRVYLNTGEGFKYAPELLPELRTFTKEVVSFDYDLDGDQDLMVFGRVVYGKYPESPQSYLLENNQGKLTDVSHLLPRKGRLGMVAAAEPVDLNGDGKEELIFASEWEPIQVLTWNGTRFEMAPLNGVENLNGHWQSLKAVDINQDGFKDLLVGNIGLNNVFAEHLPLKLYDLDPDNDGRSHPILSWNMLNSSGKRKQFPLAHKDDMVSEIPYLKTLYRKYDDYAKLDMESLLNLAKHKPEAYTVNCMESFVLINDREGGFAFQAFPRSAQAGPINTFVLNDFDMDGQVDILCMGNNQKISPGLGWNNNFRGALFKLEDGMLKPVSTPNLNLDTEIRDAVLIGPNRLIISSYADALKTLTW